MGASISYAAHATHVQAHVWYELIWQIFTQKIVRTCSQKGVKTSQTRTFSDHAIMSHMSADQNPRDFKMNGCRLKIWPLLRGTSRCPCRRCRCPVLTAPNYVTSRSNANCLHMDMGMPWVHGAVRVGHIETRLTSITLLFLLVFCWFPWTNCRTWSIFSSAPHYPGHYGRERSNRSRTSDGDGVLSSEDLKINGEWDWSCGSTSICRIGRDMSKTFKDAVSTFDVFHANGSIY